MNQEFDQTLKKYKITASDLCREVGISTAALSKFRTGKCNLTTENLHLLMQAMEKVAPGSRRHFCTLLAKEDLEEIKSQFELMTVNQICNLIKEATDCLAQRNSKKLAGTLSGTLS